MVKKTKLKNAINKNKAVNQKLAAQKAKDQVRSFLLRSLVGARQTLVPPTDALRRPLIRD